MKIQPSVVRRAIAAASVACVAALCFAAGALAQDHPPPQPLGPAKLLVIDGQALMTASNVGQDMGRQAQDLKRAADGELRSEGEALQREKQALEQNVAIYAADVKEQKIRAFQAKATAFQQKLRMRLIQIQYGLYLAQTQVKTAVNPIVLQVMKERGATIMVDRRAVIVLAPGLDVTQTVIDRLNQKLPTVKVQLATPPPNVMQQMLAQQQQ